MKIEKGLMNFIDNTPNAFCCVENMKEILIKNGFVELFEGDTWDSLKADGKYFVTRNDSSLIAFKMTDKNKKTGFNIVAAHTDSPSFALKPKAEVTENGYLKLNVDGYGGMINYSWLDRPLSIAGRVIVATKGGLEKHIINIKKDLLVIPSQAIHINRDVNNSNPLNKQTDMMPIYGLDGDLKITDIITNELGIARYRSGVDEYDLYLYNRDKAKYVGQDKEFILAPRLDDLGSLYPALKGFIDSKQSQSIDILCAFNNEEIGSLTSQGADSTFLMDVLTRISQAAEIDLLPALHNSIVVSADNAHAVHPNAGSKSDPTNKVYINRGVVIKHHTNYSTDALSSSMFKQICLKANVPFQDFACRSDMPCGTTLGGISQSHVSVDSVDIGLPQLAMHSANELVGTKDVLYMYKALLEFYETTFIKEKNMIKIIK